MGGYEGDTRSLDNGSYVLSLGISGLGKGQ